VEKILSLSIAIQIILTTCTTCIDSDISCNAGKHQLATVLDKVVLKKISKEYKELSSKKPHEYFTILTARGHTHARWDQLLIGQLVFTT